MKQKPLKIKNFYCEKIVCEYDKFKNLCDKILIVSKKLLDSRIGFINNSWIPDEASSDSILSSRTPMLETSSSQAYWVSTPGMTTSRKRNCHCGVRTLKEQSDFRVRSSAIHKENHKKQINSQFDSYKSKKYNNKPFKYIRFIERVFVFKNAEFNLYTLILKLKNLGGD